jgi:hypothetical protein
MIDDCTDYNEEETVELLKKAARRVLDETGVR